MNEQLLIRQLKQLPRVGQGSTKKAADQYGGGSPSTGNTSSGGIADLVSDLAEIVTALMTSAGISTVESGFENVSTQLSKITGQVDSFTEKLKLSVAASGQLSQGFAEVAQSTKQFLLTTQEVNQGAIELDGRVRGVSRSMKGVKSEADNAAVFVARMQTGFRLAGTEAANLAVAGLAYTGNVKDFNIELTRTAIEIEKSRNAQDAFAVIVKEISTTSALTRGYIGDQTEELAKAAFMADRLGVSMDASMIAGKKTLDIESSIAAEMELMALTGRSITDESGNNLAQKMREATATGDIVSLMEAQEDLAENYSDIIQDPLLSKSLANFSGFSEDQLANLNETIKARKASAAIAIEQGVPQDQIEPPTVGDLANMEITGRQNEAQVFEYQRSRAAITAVEEVDRTAQFLRTAPAAAGTDATAANAIVNESLATQLLITESLIGLGDILTKINTALSKSGESTPEDLAAAAKKGLDGSTLKVVLDGRTGTGIISTSNTLNQTGATSGAAGANMPKMGGD